MEQLIFLAIAILYGIGVGIYRFVKWVNRLATGTAPAPSPIQPAIEQATAEPQATAPTLAKRPRSLSQARPMPRQPQAGGPAVPWEATEREFRRREQELFAEEPDPLGVSLLSATPNPKRSALTLLSSTDDLVRAIILQEALGPPLSRRSFPQ